MKGKCKYIRQPWTVFIWMCLFVLGWLLMDRLMRHGWSHGALFDAVILGVAVLINWPRLRGDYE